MVCPYGASDLRAARILLVVVFLRRLPSRRGAAGPVALEQAACGSAAHGLLRSEEHTSELQSLMRISYAVFCLKKKKIKKHETKTVTRKKNKKPTIQRYKNSTTRNT